MRTVRVHLGERSYSISIGRRVLSRLGSLARKFFSGGKVVVVTDRNVAPILGPAAVKSLERVGFDTALFSVPPGERSKSMSQLGRVFDKFAAFRMERGCGVVALGGGVVGDLAGFAAATYLRGLPYIQVPTTLLALVDSSVGGKTAIDHQSANLEGSTLPRETSTDFWIS